MIGPNMEFRQTPVERHTICFRSDAMATRKEHDDDDKKS
jgi:hypothetical protein